MLIEVALNGTRSRAEHPAVPETPRQQADEARAACAAGAGAIHVHVRAGDGRESLAREDVARSVEAIRAACPGVPVGVSTGAWILPDLGQRLARLRAWDVLPDFASVNLHEAGALQVIEVLLAKGVGVEAGVGNATSAEKLRKSGLAEACLRILLEPAEGEGAAGTNLRRIEAALASVRRPRLLHGIGASAWKLVAFAAMQGWDTRTGFEDTLTLPDGSRAESNAALVTAAWRVVAAAVRGEKQGSI